MSAVTLAMVLTWRVMGFSEGMPMAVLSSAAAPHSELASAVESPQLSQTLDSLGLSIFRSGGANGQRLRGHQTILMTRRRNRLRPQLQEVGLGPDSRDTQAVLRYVQCVLLLIRQAVPWLCREEEAAPKNHKLFC